MKNILLVTLIASISFSFASPIPSRFQEILQLLEQGKRQQLFNIDMPELYFHRDRIQSRFFGKQFYGALRRTGAIAIFQNQELTDSLYLNSTNARQQKVIDLFQLQL